MRKRTETVFMDDGIEFRVEKGVHPVITRTVVQATQEERRTLRHRLGRLLGKRLRRVDIRDKRGGSNKKLLGGLIVDDGRMVIYARAIEDIAKTERKRGQRKNWGRTVAADEITRHEFRHLTSNNEKRIRRQSKKKTKQRHGGKIID